MTKPTERDGDDLPSSDDALGVEMSGGKEKAETSAEHRQTKSDKSSSSDSGSSDGTDRKLAASPKAAEIKDEERGDVSERLLYGLEQLKTDDMPGYAKRTNSLTFPELVSADVESSAVCTGTGYQRNSFSHQSCHSIVFPFFFPNVSSWF